MAAPAPADAGAGSGVSAVRRGKKQELADLAQRHEAARQAVARKEKELAGLRGKITDLERSFQQLTKETGARKERVDVSTLKGPPAIKQVGAEMASAIRRRQARRKGALHDKLNKLRAKLSDSQAHNKELRQEIDDRRRARVHHLAAVKMGGSAVERSNNEIGDLIVAAQRAYAEKETSVLRRAELEKKAAEEEVVMEQKMAEAEMEMEVIEEERRQRDAEIVEIERETSAALAEARREEESRDQELEHFASVRNARLELANGVEQMYSALNVSTLDDLLDGYKMTASKNLSLWAKQVGGGGRRG